MHALSFVHYSLIHMTNWIINGLPERFPKLKVLWIESGQRYVHLDQYVLLLGSACAPCQ